MKVVVGVFWLCNFDIIWDKEEYEITDNQNTIIDYSKQHKEVWENLSKNQCNGKYSKFKYDFFLRGRVAYDCETKSYDIELNNLTENLSESIKSRIKQLFKIS